MEGCIRTGRSLGLVTLLVTASSVVAQGVKTPPRQAPMEAKTAAAPVVIDPDGTRMERLLKLWTGQSAKLTSLDAQIKRIDEKPGWPSERLEGRALFKSPNLAWLDFQKVVINQKNVAEHVPSERTICTGTEVWNYRSATKQILIYPLGKKDRERSLQEGPLPFLFNFRADEAKKRYAMTLMSESSNGYVVMVIPREAIDKECFGQAYVQLDPKYLLPTKIILISPEDPRSRKLYILSNVKPNAPVMADNFKGRKLGPPWTIHVNEEDNNPKRPVIGKRAAQGPAR